ncbi:type II toxin-antitoxin system prevent-host-death family antitoxin [Streptomyces marianii]|uniref:Antitoxin n=2 Tax=Streptomyces marianii TaxID=1817406 RepID=A0A5R9E1F6_9ACTN|nr:type II toxin-antitoxin system prevent-host-death family antitoxin [Streptomyces marianii]
MCTVSVMDETYPLVQARNELGQLVNRVRHGHETIVISDYGSPAAALIPIDELAELRRLRDEHDIAEAQRRKDGGGPVIGHDELMAELEADDTHAAAS